MKIRNDFVTNSSSSNFILATGEEFTAEQKSLIADVVLNKMMGKIVLSHTATEEEIQNYFKEEGLEEDNKYDKERIDIIRRALSKGLDIREGWIDWECGAKDLICDMYETIFEKLKETKEFEEIDTDLSY